MIFETLPVAFYSLPLGSIFSSMFFILISIAALSSSISLLEPFTAWIEEIGKLNRFLIVFILGTIIWILGLGSIFSFSVWSDLRLFGLNFLELLDYVTNNIMLPLGGFFIAILLGWVVPKNFLKDNLKLSKKLFNLFYFSLRFLAPSSIALIFLYSVS